MTQPPSPSAAALEAAKQWRESIPSVIQYDPWIESLALALDAYAAQAVAVTQTVQPRSEWAAENMRREREAASHRQVIEAVEAHVAEERAKPAASDHEAAELLRRELELLGIDMHRNIADSRASDILAGALAERGRVERQFWTDLIALHLKGRNLNVSAFLGAAAIRNQNGAEGGGV